MEFDNLDSRPGKSWNFGPGHGKSWNLILANMYAAYCCGLSEMYAGKHINISKMYYVVPNSCAVRNSSVGWKIHPN